MSTTKSVVTPSTAALAVSRMSGIAIDHAQMCECGMAVIAQFGPQRAANECATIPRPGCRAVRATCSSIQVDDST